MNIKELIEKKKKEQKKKEQKKITKAVVITAVLSTAAGTASGLLFAPKSGKETREELINKVNETSEQVKEKVVVGKDNFIEAKNKIKEYLKDKKNSEENIKTAAQIVAPSEENLEEVEK